ncbi:hypothetical protein ACQ7A7_28020, partial [Escherichia coli]
VSWSRGLRDVYKRQPLMKVISAQQAISALKYMVDGEIYF